MRKILDNYQRLLLVDFSLWPWAHSVLTIPLSWWRKFCWIFFFFFFSFVRWKLQSPRWRWQCIASPSGFRRACGLRECGLARFPFWVARRWGRTAVDVLLSDCQYRKGTALCDQCGVWNTGDSWGGCGLSWAWTLSLVPVWLTDSRNQPCCTVGFCWVTFPVSSWVTSRVFWSSSSGAFSGCSGFLPSFVAYWFQPIK